MSVVEDSYEIILKYEQNSEHPSYVFMLRQN